MGRLWSRLRRPVRPRRRRPNGECPICRRPVVVGSNTYPGTFYGPMMVPWTRAELVAACPVHGGRGA